MRERIEREKRTYGTPAFEHNSCTRLPMIDDDGEWDVMAEAVVLDSDHTVDAYTNEKLQDDMIHLVIVAFPGAQTSDCAFGKAGSLNQLLGSNLAAPHQVIHRFREGIWQCIHDRFQAGSNPCEPPGY